MDAAHPWLFRRGLRGKRHPRLQGLSRTAVSAATGLWPLAVLLIKLEVTIVERGELALDEEVAHLGGDLERVAGGDDEIGNLAGFQRAELLIEAKDLLVPKR